MSQERQFLRLLPHLNSESGPYEHLWNPEDLVRATIPPSSHRSIRRSITRLSENVRRTLCTFPIKTYIFNLEPRGYTVETVHYFRFERLDWRLTWSGSERKTSRSLIGDLDHQFQIINYLSRELQGSSFTEPIPLHSKVLILREGLYYQTAGVVVDNINLLLDIFSVDGTIISVHQREIQLLDPENTLPYGLPITVEEAQRLSAPPPPIRS